MIMRCDNCGVNYDSAYGHYNCIPSPGPAPTEFIAPTKEVGASVAAKASAERRPILPVEIIESWDLSYHLGVAIDKIGKFAFDSDWEYLEEAIKALQREMHRYTGEHR